MRQTCLIVAAVALLTLSGSALDWSVKVEPVPSPAQGESAEPQLTVSKRGVLLSWIERPATGSGQAKSLATLKFAERTANGWTDPRIVASGSDWFVNWADVPSVARLEDGTLYAHWLQKSAASTYAYDVRLSRSTDDGKTWSKSFLPHTDGTQTEHGFASLFSLNGGLGLVWLDGRAMTSGHGDHGGGDMSLRFGAFSRDGKQIAETPLDARVCECCPTAVAVTSDGPIVAYRDRSAGEVRDIYVARMENGKWTDGRPAHDDHWKINACPVNGPSLSARGRDVALGWFTAKDDQPRSYVAFSKDAGRTFGAPIRLDDAASLGRVDVELLADGSAVATYIEFANQRADFRLRRVTADGSKSAAVTISDVAGTARAATRASPSAEMSWSLPGWIAAPARRCAPPSPE